jgi:DNA-binding MarR family transcriptional regulator
MTALYDIIVEIRRSFHTLSAAADAAHDDLGITAGQRAVLEALSDSPDSTVPDIARSKRVTRQHIQVLVNQLLAAGLIEQRENPAHKRSPILRLTASGDDCFREVRRRERRILRSAAPALAGHDLPAVLACLRDLNRQLDGRGTRR